MKLFFLLFFFVSFDSQALLLDKILRFNDAASLKSYIKENNQKNFLKILCEKQKENQRIPLACYELSLDADFWCLQLDVEKLNLKILNSSLSSKSLSLVCREHLQEKQKLLLYREKDFFLPELRNYWTD